MSDKDLSEFFREIRPDMGRVGDYNFWTPEETARFFLSKMPTVLDQFQYKVLLTDEKKLLGEEYRDLDDMKTEQAFMDPKENVVTRPTAWAWYAACRTLDRLHDKMGRIHAILGETSGT